MPRFSPDTLSLPGGQPRWGAQNCGHHPFRFGRFVEGQLLEGEYGYGNIWK